MAFRGGVNRGEVISACFNAKGGATNPKKSKSVNSVCAGRTSVMQQKPTMECVEASWCGSLGTNWHAMTGTTTMHTSSMAIIRQVLRGIIDRTAHLFREEKSS